MPHQDNLASLLDALARASARAARGEATLHEVGLAWKAVERAAVEADND